MACTNSGRHLRSLAAVAWTAALCLTLVVLPAGTRSAAREGVPPDFPVDPLGRLPSSPQAAHKRLEGPGYRRPGGGEGEVFDGEWPDTGRGEGPFLAAEVQSGLLVSLPQDTVEGKTTHPGSGVRVELIREPQTWTLETTTTPGGWFSVDFGTLGTEISSGDRVRVTDLAGGLPVEVECLLTAVADTAEDRVYGTAAAGNQVDVYIKTPSLYYEDVPPGAAKSTAAATGGTYQASFTGLDIRDGDVAYVFSSDAAGNTVMEVARTGPALVVYPQYDEVMGFYLPGSTVTVEAGTASRTVGVSRLGFFDAWFLDHDILPGDKVSADLGGSRSVTVGDVSASADPFTDLVKGKAPPGREIRITMDIYGQPVTVETASDSQGFFSYDLTGLYKVSGMEVYNVAWYNEAGDCVVYEFQTYSWFLPEGYTGQGFDEWILIMNPSQEGVQVRVLFQTAQGEVEGPLFTAMPGSRINVHVNDWTPGQEVSTMVTAMDGGDIMAERAMYMYGTVDGKWGAHDSIGIMTPSHLWYLPEGATYFGFDQWVLVQNPNDVEVTVKVSFHTQGGIAKSLEAKVAPRSRYTVHANDHVPATEFSTRVECLTREGGVPLPVFAERAMYMNTPDGKRGAHDSIGSSTPAPEWYLPEGCTRPGFDEWVLIMNPNETGTWVRVLFLTPSGIGAVREMGMNPQSRATVHVNEVVPGNDVSVTVVSLDGAGILAERAMYMNTPDGKRGAHDSLGSFRAERLWYLPEGCTRPGFDEWILVQNPNDAEVPVRVTLLGPSGPVAQQTFVMLPQSRFNVHPNDLAPFQDLAAVVESLDEAGILSERAMYMWTADNKQGSHCSIGIPVL